MPISLYDQQGEVKIQDPTEAEGHIVAGRGDFLPDQEVYIKDAEKGLMKVKGSEASNLIKLGTPGVTLASDLDIEKGIAQKQYGGPLQQTIAAGEGLISGATLGTGRALTKSLIGLTTPKGSDLPEKYVEGAKGRQEANPVTSAVGEVSAALIDPLGAYSTISKGVKAVTPKVVQGGIKATEKLAPDVIAKIAKTPIVEKSIERGLRYGTEGAVVAGSYETGKQLADSEPINPDAILSEMKKGFAVTAPLGPIVTVGEQAGIKAFNEVKKQAKTYLDKITNAPVESRGEVFSELPRQAMKKEQDLITGRRQKSIRLVDDVAQAEGQPNKTYSYRTDTREGNISLDPAATGLDLNNPGSVDDLGRRAGISDLGDSFRWDHKEGETLFDFTMRQKDRQRVRNSLEDISPFMSQQDLATYEQIKKIRKALKDSPSITPQGKHAYNGLLRAEDALLSRQSMQRITPKNISKLDEESVRKALSEFDYVVSKAEKGKNGDVYIFNESIIPESVTTKLKRKGATPISFEASEAAKQFKMTPKQMEMKGRGNQRLNDVSEFIFDQYPKEGGVIKNGTTSVDTILENISEKKAAAGLELDDVVSQALNSGSRQTLTYDDIAGWAERNILPQFQDATTGNPKAGFTTEHNQIKGFIDSFKENGYTVDQYGRRVYRPMSIDEIRNLRIDLDKKARFDKDTLTVIQDAARDMRTYLEDQVMSRVGENGAALKEKYNIAKRTYGLASDAEKIVGAAARKAAKGTKFSFFYSGVGAGVGAGVAGAPGAIIGGLLGGAVNNAVREYSGALSVMMARDLGKNVQRYENAIKSAARSFIKPLEITKNAYIRTPQESDRETMEKDYLRMSKEIVNQNELMEKFIDNNEPLFNQFPQTSEKMVQKMITAREFLISKIPTNPYEGNPAKEKLWQPPKYEVNKYMRYREAVQNPRIILGQFKDGYITPEAAEVLKVVYPETMEALKAQLVEEISKGAEIPFKKRVEIFKTFGISMDTVTTPEGFMQAQMDAEIAIQEAEQENNIKPGTALKTNLGKPNYTLGNSTLSENP